MRKILNVVLLTLNLSIIAMVISPLNALESDTYIAIKNSLKTTLPDLTVDQINSTAIPNIYEIISGRKVFYVDGTGHYALLGNMVDLTTKQSLTELKVQELSVVDWKKLPLGIALRQVIGKGERRIAIFTDPDCPFCQHLEQDTIPKLKNVTVYYFLYPLAMHANAESDSKKILCSEIPDQTFINWMKDNKTLPTRTTCKNASQLAEMKDVATQVAQIEATPTIILPNGVILAGLVPPDYLNKLITETSPKPTTSAPVANTK